MEILKIYFVQKRLFWSFYFDWSLFWFLEFCTIFELITEKENIMPHGVISQQQDSSDGIKHTQRKLMSFQSRGSCGFLFLLFLFWIPADLARWGRLWFHKNATCSRANRWGWNFSGQTRTLLLVHWVFPEFGLAIKRRADHTWGLLLMADSFWQNWLWRYSSTKTQQ